MATGIEEEEDMEEGNWIPCGKAPELIDSMVKDGFLPNKKYRLSVEDTEPSPKDGERVILASHIQRGLGFPPSSFFI